MKKRKSGAQHRQDAKRRKDSAQQMSQSMSTFLATPERTAQQNQNPTTETIDVADDTPTRPPPERRTNGTSHSSEIESRSTPSSSVVAAVETVTASSVTPVRYLGKFFSPRIMTSVNAVSLTTPSPSSSTRPQTITSMPATPVSLKATALATPLSSKLAKISAASSRYIAAAAFTPPVASPDRPSSIDSLAASASSTALLTPTTGMQHRDAGSSTILRAAKTLSFRNVNPSPVECSVRSPATSCSSNSSSLTSTQLEARSTCTVTFSASVTAENSDCAASITCQQSSPNIPACSNQARTPGPDDIAIAITYPGGPQKLPDHQKYYLLQQTVKPRGEPSGWPGEKRSGYERRITPYCYEKFGKWLTYSKFYGGLFCKFCVFFEASQTGQLVSLPCVRFSRLTGPRGHLYEHHFNVKYHDNAELKAQNFIKCYENPDSAIDNALDSALQQRKRKNRDIITSIAETVVLCARMGSAFRGHRDDGPLVPPENINSIITHQGHFRTLTQLYSLASDSLSDHLNTCDANAAYISKTIQNQLIECMGKAITRSIAEKVRNAKFFTILADETTDASRDAQLSLSLRYVYAGNILEEFVGFVKPESLTGEGLANEILFMLESLGVDLTHVVGQGYDGAAAMSSNAKGVQANVKLRCGPQAVYVHCVAHALNLTLVKASDVPQIRNAFGVVTSVASFFNSSTVRSGRLQKELEASESTHSKRSLKAPCQTRWVEKHEAIHAMYDMYTETGEVLGEMSTEKSSAARDANSWLTSMSSVEFAVSLCILNEVMTVTKQLSVALQSSGNSLIGALRHVKTVEAHLKIWRNDNRRFDQIAEKAKKLLGGTELTVPRLAGRQTKRCNVPHTGPVDYYRKAIYLPFMDCLLSQFDSRFKSHDKVAMMLCGLLPKMMPTTDFCHIKAGVELYQHLLPGDVDSIKIEFETWKLHCRDMEFPSDDCMVALDSCPKMFYPNIHDLLLIFATLPVSTATAERSFSSLKYIKNYLRSTMGEERLNGLALAFIHKGMNVSEVVEQTVNIFASESRRFKL